MKPLCTFVHSATSVLSITQICDDSDNEQLVVGFTPYLLFEALADGACQAPLRALCLAQTGLDDKAAKHLGRALASPYLKHLKASVIEEIGWVRDLEREWWIDRFAIPIKPRTSALFLHITPSPASQTNDENRSWTCITTRSGTRAPWPSPTG